MGILRLADGCHRICGDDGGGHDHRSDGRRNGGQDCATFADCALMARTSIGRFLCDGGDGNCVVKKTRTTWASGKNETFVKSEKRKEAV